MKKTLPLFLLVLFFLSGQCFAAGTCNRLPDQTGSPNGTFSTPNGIVIECTTDASDASIEGITITGMSAHLESCEYIEDATVPPDSAIILLTTLNDTPFTGYPSAVRTTSGFLIAQGDQAPLDFSGGFKLAASAEGGTVIVGNAKKFRLVCNIF